MDVGLNGGNSETKAQPHTRGWAIDLPEGMTMAKELKDWTFEELVKRATREAHDGLLTEGGKGLHSAMFLHMDIAIRWHMANQKKKK